MDQARLRGRCLQLNEKRRNYFSCGVVLHRFILTLINIQIDQRRAPSPNCWERVRERASFLFHDLDFLFRQAIQLIHQLIDRLAELAKTRPANRYVSPQDFNRARAARSAALGILGRPVVLTNESLLKRIPNDVIHSLMADLHLRIRKADNRITVITADGRE
jgi:hypothetical protein